MQCKIHREVLINSASQRRLFHMGFNIPIDCRLSSLDKSQQWERKKVNWRVIHETATVSVCFAHPIQIQHSSKYCIYTSIFAQWKLVFKVSINVITHYYMYLLSVMNYPCMISSPPSWLRCTSPWLHIPHSWLRTLAIFIHLPPSCLNCTPQLSQLNSRHSSCVGCTRHSWKSCKTFCNAPFLKLFL